MPKSPIRRRTVYTPQPSKSAADLPSPRWLAPTMIGFFLFGLLWVVIYYITRGDWPVSAFNNWNLVVGFGFMGIGFILSTRWK
ncbi:MAG: cell division protein CrgA [Sporichthyaceae bacterium]|nr:cell division protein CrgA [Sporichthyaceae bacterium]